MIRPVLVATATALLLAGCASSNMPRFTTDSAPGFSPAAFKTYSWAFTRAPQGMNPLMYERLRNSFDMALAARGFTRVETGGDMIVGFTVGARDRVQTTDWGPVGPTYTGWGRWTTSSWAFRYRDIDVRTVTQGSLAFDVFDGRTNQPVWHGFAARDLNGSNVPPELVTNAVNGLVERFAGPARTS
jgi:hypothetical protein